MISLLGSLIFILTFKCHLLANGKCVGCVLTYWFDLEVYFNYHNFRPIASQMKMCIGWMLTYASFDLFRLIASQLEMYGLCASFDHDLYFKFFINIFGLIARKWGGLMTSMIILIYLLLNMERHL